MKKILLPVFLFCASFSLFAQLDKVAPLSSIVHNYDQLKNVNIILNTKDFTSKFMPTKRDSFFTTVQIVSATEPFPPKWYQIGKNSLISGGSMHSDFYLDAEIQEKSGHLSFVYSNFPNQSSSPVLSGFVALDTTTFEVTDTITNHTFTFDSILDPNDLHEYKEDGRGNKMFYSVAKTRIDARCLSGNPADSLVGAAIEYIVVLDSVNHVKFIWNPLKHLSPCEMRYEWRNQSTSYVDALNWNHANSVTWSNDGNILYSFRHVGIGKINAKTGAVMFKLGGKDTINSIHLPDSIAYSLQHDFYQRPDGKYSLFSNGDDSIQKYMEGLLYEIDEKNKTVKLYDRYRPQPYCKSKALGGFDTYNNMYFFNRGMNFCSGNQMVDIVNVNDKSPVAELFGPAFNYSYRAHPTNWNISKRPAIAIKNEQLVSDSTVGLYDFTWYKIDSLTAVKVGNGLIYNPVSVGKYVVEAKIGKGIFTSYLVSDPVNYLITNAKKSENGEIVFVYDTITNTANIDIVEDKGLLKIYNINGQLMRQKYLSGNHSEIYFKKNAGVYIFDITTKKAHITTKVLVQ